MPTGSNLKVRKNVYYARLRVPVDLRHLMGTGELTKSLETKDRRTANAAKLPILSEWYGQFDSLRRRRDMVEADFANATWDHYATELRADELERSIPELTNATRMLGHREHHLKAIREHLGRGETVLIEWAADAFIDRYQLLTKPGTSQYRELCFRLMRAQIEVLLRAGERDVGNYAGMPADPVVTRPAATPEIAKPGERLMDLFERYAKENPKRVSKANLDDTRKDIGTFVDLMGEDFPVSKLDKKAAREWKGMLGRYPLRAKDRAIFKGLTFKEIVAANERLPSPIPTISAKTINSYMAGFGGFCNWLAAHDYIATNPFQGMYLSVDKTKTNVRPFTGDELKVLFASPLFTGCKNEMKWHVPGDLLIRDHRYWLPHVMMYSGARPGEIAQLLVDDVRQMHGVWVMHFTDEGDDEKSLKTKGSVRVVPVHSKLIEMGFIEHVERARKAGERRVFPEAERNERGQIAAKFEKKFGIYLGKLGLKDGRGLTLYSFRHGWADAMRRAGLMNDDFSFLMGHQSGDAGQTPHYGSLPQGTLQKRVELIEAVSYES